MSKLASIFLSLILLLGGLAASGARADDPVVARVNGKAVSDGDLKLAETEIVYLESLQNALGLPDEEARAMFEAARTNSSVMTIEERGEKMKSPDTDSWLVEHRYSGKLVCHLTGYMMDKPLACPNCGAKGSLTGVGPGVERLAEEVHTRFHGSRVEVLSSDTT